MLAAITIVRTPREHHGAPPFPRRKNPNRRAVDGLGFHGIVSQANVRRDERGENHDCRQQRGERKRGRRDHRNLRIESAALHQIGDLGDRKQCRGKESQREKQQRPQSHSELHNAPHRNLEFLSAAKHPAVENAVGVSELES